MDSGKESTFASACKNMDQSPSPRSARTLVPSSLSRRENLCTVQLLEIRNLNVTAKVLLIALVVVVFVFLECAVGKMATLFPWSLFFPSPGERERRSQGTGSRENLGTRLPFYQQHIPEKQKQLLLVKWQPCSQGLSSSRPSEREGERLSHGTGSRENLGTRLVKWFYKTSEINS